ncbi:hypothetical protein G6O69_10800 [Pseudenhygromyxa sp. WMMC2535]|uniref:hypothetical protein n=1 Tax=Pseudenhygromyxa sp. WMMC2535 TaxID=2712867 RepID=UPI00159594EE|nr:hypothetical protein [Pseudenhygromyxa sp. WMMC2535]NVB38320.1 hypothetical protein [Pseudenhygromyxa sp. WMMC2535]
MQPPPARRSGPALPAAAAMLQSRPVTRDPSGNAGGDKGERKRRRKRLGILIRLAIYIPLLAFFGWRAAARFTEEREASDEAFRAGVQQRLEQPPEVIMLPNGEAMQVISPEQASAMGVEISPAPADPTAPAEPPEPPDPADP